MVKYFCYFDKKNFVKRMNKYKISCVYVCVCVPMPTHCTITCFGFHTRQIDGIECGLFSIHINALKLCI